jgi:hypothetical protein
MAQKVASATVISAGTGSLSMSHHRRLRAIVGFTPVLTRSARSV